MPKNSGWKRKHYGSKNARPPKKRRNNSTSEEEVDKKLTLNNLKENNSNAINPFQDIQGVLITSQHEQERKSLKEITQLLNDMVQASQCSDEDKNQSSTSITKKLESEISELQKTTNSRPKFSSIPTKLRGISFLSIPDRSINPIHLVDSIFDQILNSKKQSTRYTVRLIPLLHTCYSSNDALKKSITPYIEESFPKCSSYAIVYKKRASDSIERSFCIDTVANLIKQLQPEAKVNLDSPEVVIIIEVLGRFTGFSILDNGSYMKYKKMNIRNLYDELITE